jgi:hypothetical protein
VRQVVDSDLLATLTTENGRQVIVDSDLFYDFANDVHWASFVDYLRTVRSIDYEGLEPLEKARLCSNSDVLTDYLKRTPRFAHYRGDFYFYTLPIADATHIELYRVSIEEVLEHLNSARSSRWGRVRAFITMRKGATR